MVVLESAVDQVRAKQLWIQLKSGTAVQLIVTVAAADSISLCEAAGEQV
jgi:hypothetical protein